MQRYFKMTEAQIRDNYNYQQQFTSKKRVSVNFPFLYWDEGLCKTILKKY